jgi:hypothetical protein
MIQTRGIKMISTGVIVIGVLVVIADIGLGFGYNKLVIKDYPPRDKKAGSVGAFVVFILISVVIYGILVGRLIGISVTDDFTQKMEKQINDDPQAGFIKKGVDFKDMEIDSSRAGAAVIGIKQVLPKSSDFKVPRFLYDMIMDKVTGQMQSALKDPENSKKFVASFTEDNVLTVASLTNGLRLKIIGIINTITLVLVSIFVVLLGIYIIASLRKAARQRRRVAFDAETEKRAAAKNNAE